MKFRLIIMTIYFISQSEWIRKNIRNWLRQSRFQNNIKEEIKKWNRLKIDLITLSFFVLSLYHYNITLCYEQDLQQVLSSELN